MPSPSTATNAIKVTFRPDADAVSVRNVAENEVVFIEVFGDIFGCVSARRRRNESPDRIRFSVTIDKMERNASRVYMKSLARAKWA